MAGVKGRSGGARPGAGRKPEPKKVITVKASDPLEFLLEVMKDQDADAALRVRAAAYAIPYTHAKRGEGGKSDEKKKRAEEAGAGKFAPAAPPKLVVNNGS